MTFAARSPFGTRPAFTITDVETRAERTQRHLMPWLLSAIGVIDALLFFLIRPDVNDLWAARARANASAHGVGLTYWFSWFGGGSTPGNYSIITPWLSSLIGSPMTGPVLLCALAAAAIPPLVARLVSGTEHPTAAQVVTLLTVGFNLWSGRVAFLVAGALGVAALIQFREHRLARTLVLILLSMLASPTIAAFIAVGLAGVFLRGIPGRPSRFHAAGVVIVIGAALLVIQALYGSPGPETFASTLRTQLICGLALLWLARPPAWLRTALWLSLFTILILSNVSNALGSNILRLVWFCLPVAVVATSRRPWWLVALLSVPMLVIGGNMTLTDLKNASHPVSSAAYYTPLIAELGTLNMTNTRLELVDHGAHAGYDVLLGHALLARGWETQDDDRLNKPIVTPGLTADAYKSWLDDNAVGYVALPATTLIKAVPEYLFVTRDTPDYLTPIWTSKDWTLFRVQGSQPIVPAPATVVSATQAKLTVDMPCACSITIRVHYSTHLRSTGSAKVRDNGSKWVTLTTPRPGTYELHGG